LLHGLDIAIGMRQRHRFNRLAFKVQELSVQIGQGPLALFGTRKQRREVGVIGEQFVGERLHIARRQVDDRRLAGRGRCEQRRRRNDLHTLSSCGRDSKIEAKSRCNTIKAPKYIFLIYNLNVKFNKRLSPSVR